MTRHTTLAAFAAAAMFHFAAQPLHAAPPAMDALKATKIATDYLAKRGAGATHIVSVVLERSSLANPTYSWAVRWSDPMEAESGKEIGLRVNFDGSIAKLVEGKGGGRKKQGTAPGFR